MFFSIALFSFSGVNEKQEEQKKEMEVNTSQPTTYVIGIVKQGENWKKDSLRAFELQEQHLKFLDYLVANNKLIASGPLTTSSDARGLYIFRVKTIKEAEELTAKDQAMSEGWISMDFYVWKSRDYAEPEISTELASTSNSLIGLKGISIVFAIIILIFIIRTFRYKANV